MSQLKKLSEGMGAAFRQAREDNQNAEKDFNTPPDGNYICRISNSIRKVRNNGVDQYLQNEYYQTQGDRSGKTEYQFLNLTVDRIRDVERFFSSLGFDTLNLDCDDPTPIIDSWCALISKQAPEVKIRTKRWYKKDKDSGTLILDSDGNPTISGCNFYINSVSDEWIDQLSDNQPADQVDTPTSDDGLDGLDKKALRDIVMDDASLDISTKFLATKTAEEIIAEIRKQRSSLPADSSLNDNLTGLLALCDSQGITSLEKDGGVDVTTMTEEEIIKLIDEYYSFVTEGKGALTKDEVNVLIDNNLEHKINFSEEKKTEPEPKKPTARKTSKK